MINKISKIRSYHNNWSQYVKLWLIMWQKKTIKTIDHHNSTTKGLLSNLLMFNDIGQNRSFHNNWSSHINHKRTIVTIVKNSNVIMLPQKSNFKKEITYQLHNFSILMIDDIIRNRSYQNNWSQHINHKRTIFNVTND